MATKQLIEIDVTWDTYGKKLSLSWLTDKIANAGLEIKRISVKEKK